MSRRPLRTTPTKFGRRSLYEKESDLPSEGSECLFVARRPSAHDFGWPSEEERPISTSVVAIWYPGVGWRYSDIQAWRDFPSAEHPPTWYSNPPVASGEPKPYFESALCRLPVELRTEIWKMYIEDNRGWDLNIDTPTWRTCSGRIRRSRDFITRGVENVLQVCKDLKIEFEGCLMSVSMYYYKYSNHESFRDAPWVLGRYGLRLISYLDLYAHNDLLRKPETEYPQLLRILSRDLPNLKWIRFSRKYTTDAIHSQQHGHGVNPHQWTYRAVVLLELGPAGVLLICVPGRGRRQHLSQFHVRGAYEQGHCEKHEATRGKSPLEEAAVAGLGADADVDEDMLGDVEITIGSDGRSQGAGRTCNVDVLLSVGIVAVHESWSRGERM
ncbi:hypothetical protein LTR06_007644 [Exophiala xenobiotica]|nr:hypothetical protein LTR06_007644 [Exophiala xenobiotica]